MNLSKKFHSTKNYLFIDGSNLYAGQFQLFGPHKYLNFSEFIKQTEKKLKISFKKIYFYASYSKRPRRVSKKQKQYLINEFLFYKNAKKVKKLTFIKGKRSKTSGKEKGVDVALATDILKLGYENKYKTAYILTGDADFAYVLQALKAKKPIKVLCIENRIPYPLAYQFKTTVVNFTGKKLKFGHGLKIKQIQIKNPMCSDIG